MVPSVEQVVEELDRAFRNSRRVNRGPAKARAFLLRAGIAEKTRKTKSNPHGIRLAKRFR